MPKYSDLGIRMKEYEGAATIKLTRRTPVIMRLDMCHGHTFTRGMKKPMDPAFQYAMKETMRALCDNIQNCVFGYTQSDEISLLLNDYRQLNTQSWFDNKVEKICSVGAALATYYFNKFFKEKNTIEKFNDRVAVFDCRCFNLPKSEVCNYFYWRQEDAIRNSILSYSRFFFSQKDIQNLSCRELKKKMFDEANYIWELSTPIPNQRGYACFKKDYVGVGWYVDNKSPIFLKEDREYIEKWIKGDEY